MKFSILTLIPASLAVSLSYDPTYDNPNTQIASLACSDGANGLLHYGSTISSLPGWPRVGGIPAIGGWNSPSCGTCWAVNYNGNVVNILGIDVGSGGFNVAQQAMDQLTGGHAVEFGRVEVSVTQVDLSQCH